MLDAVMFVATLVSKSSDIDVQLDRVRTMTALRSTSQLTKEDNRVLGEIYSYLENYLVKKEALRSFTPDSIREKVSDYLHGKSTSLLMFELLVPAEKSQLDQLNGDKKAYDVERRPRLMVQAIQQLQDAQVEPDVWKVEGLDRYQECETIVATARRNGRDNVGCIILGRGEDATKVREWLTVAAGVPGFIGFAVGRTVFWDPLVAWRAGTTTREATVAEVARRYKQFVDTFDAARASSPARTG